MIDWFSAERLRIAIIGAGGVGGFFGGLLAQAGHDVVFVARGAHLRTIRARGLKIEHVDAEPQIIAPANATDDCGELGPVDLVMLCTKMYDLKNMLEQIRPLVDEHTVIMTLQNGVEAPSYVSEVYGPQFVLPGIAYCEVSLKEPGVIVQHSPVQRIVFGELDGALSPRAQAIAAAFRGAAIEVELSQNIQGALWSKFCFICALSGVTALTGQPLGPIMSDPESQELLRTVITEASQVASAYGVQFDADPIDAGMHVFSRFPPTAQSSMARDVARGAQIEVEWLNGAIVRMGRASQIPTPANLAIYAALRLSQSASHTA
jgi:2-dehydropantoate 2-reductase